MTNTSYITNGLVAYWKLNDGSGTNAADSSGNGYTLALFNTPSWEINDCGAFCLSLDGSSQYGDAGNAFNRLGYCDLTMCAWINKTGLSEKGIVDASSDSNSSGWGFWVQADGTLCFHTGSGSQTLSDNGGGEVVPGQWMFVTVVWHRLHPDGSAWQEADFYYNGLWSSSKQDSSADDTWPSRDMQVGNRQDNLSNGLYAFDGSMRDIAIYDSALTSNQIETNFLNSEFSTNVPYPDLLYYKMTESAQTNPPIFLADSSYHGGTTGTYFATNSELWVPDVGSIPDTSLHFNGASSYIDTTNTVLFDFTTNLFTINLWVFPTNSADRFLMQNCDPETNNGWYIHLGGAYQIEFATAAGGSVSAISTGDGSDGAQNETWTMVTVVRTASTNSVIYINGRQMADGNLPSPSSSAISLKFGVDPTLSNHLDGNIWLPQIWGEALPGTAVLTLYNNQLSGIPWP